MTVPASELLKPHDPKASRLMSVATPRVFITRAWNWSQKVTSSAFGYDIPAVMERREPDRPIMKAPIEINKTLILAA